MRRFFQILFFFAGIVGLGLVQAEAATIVARINISSQTMTVVQNGVEKFYWPVSTAREGKVTPTGSWTAKYLKRHHRSSRYGGAPMPYSIFYSGNFAIHGTNSVAKLGSPASAGCVRLSRANAATLFAMVKRIGVRNTHVVIEY